MFIALTVDNGRTNINVRAEAVAYLVERSDGKTDIHLMMPGRVVVVDEPCDEVIQRLMDMHFKLKE